MTEELNHKTFDLAEVLAGRSYPEDTVDVYFDEKLGHTINKLNEAISESDRRGDGSTAEELQKDLDALLKDVEDAKYTFHLKGVPEHVKKAILREVREKYPVKRNPFGMPEEDLDADELLTRKFWATYILKVTDPAGRESLMSEELAQKLQDQAPKSALKAINACIDSLSEGSERGFEFAAREVPFLSIASTEG